MTKLTHCTVHLDLGEGWAHWPSGAAVYVAWFFYWPNGDADQPLEVIEIERWNQSIPISTLPTHLIEEIVRQVMGWIEEQESIEAASVANLTKE